MSDQVRTVIINFQTPDLLRIAVESFRKFYPQSQLTIIDNGSEDISRDVIRGMQRDTPQHTDVLFLGENIFHGPAMHRAMNEVKEDYVFFLDSDTETNKNGFLEAMQGEIEKSANIYGVGRYLTVSKRGFQKITGITVLAPAYMMIRRNIYFDLRPFEHHGMPVLKNFVSAQERGFKLNSFPIEEYIEHRWRGTASRFGYGLGWRSKIDLVLNKMGL
jgi:glycosyltransferase involved in cell wall biosynthesis